MRSFPAALLVSGALVTQVSAAPVSFVLFEGYDALASSGGTSSGAPSGLEELNRRIRSEFQGQNYFSRLFQWNQIDEAVNFANVVPDADIFAVGYSRGGNSVAEFADRLGSRSVVKTVQIDPVRCAGDVVAGCSLGLDVDGQSPVEFQFDWPPVTVQNPVEEYTINSVGEIAIPNNVTSADSYFQKVGAVERATPLSNGGVRIQGDDSVTNSNNIDADALFGNQTTHLNIDDNPALHQSLVDDMASRLDNSRLFTGLGGSSGFGQLAMTRNDDGSTNRIDLPFEVDFGGATRSSLWINNNGNVTFDGPRSTFTPAGFAGLSGEMIAPFWGDVDTRCASCGEVFVAAPTSDTFVVTWDNVGYFNQNSDLRNTFQLVLRDRYDLTGDVFDIEFRYEDIQWVTGDASGGQGGFGGTPAYAGFTGGGNNAPQQLVGSGGAAIASVDDRSNIGDTGAFVFQIADGASPGTSFDNPLLPDVEDGTWNFRYETTQVDEIVWSDPEVAVGYDYTASGGTLFTSFILPDAIGDGIYNLSLMVGDSLLEVVSGLLGSNQYFFSDYGFDDGVDFFRITGIELTAALDPTDTTAFVTGLAFADVGEQNWSQAPLVADTDPAPIPLPPALALLPLALGLLLPLRRRS